MASEVARHLNLHSKEILVCSTGRIGVRLPMSKITSGIRDAATERERGVGRSYGFSGSNPDFRHLHEVVFCENRDFGR